MSGAGSYAEAASYRLRAHEGGGGAIVLLHGLGGDLDQLWGATDGEVGGRPVPVLAADARAHGQTQMAELGRLNFEVLAQDVTSLVDRLQLGPKLVLVGVSMGAATALALALSEPQRVHGLVLVRPAWLNERWPKNLAAFGEIARLLRQNGPVDGRARFQASSLYQDVNAISPSTAASLLDQFDKPFALSRVRRLEDLPGSVPYDRPGTVRAVRVPTLVVGAPGDPVHPVQFAEELATLVPGGRLALITPRDLSLERNLADLRQAVNGSLARLQPFEEGKARQ
ncbi:MAG: alpha/beta fold hydrolase [Acidimicrobiales bacterium]|jgi:pimeloyl-ACP methyl ester carboxylesterase